jgi:hypothetical protein
VVWTGKDYCSLAYSALAFEASIHPDHSGIRLESGVLAFGLLNFFDALAQATGDFLETLEADTALQANMLARYKFKECNANFALQP